MPIRLGVLGCASIAWRKMLPALAHEPDIVLTAVASRHADRAAEFAARFGGEPVVGYEELLARSDVDAVYIPLPAVLHAPWIRRALQAGKHVLAEKPMVTTYADAVELVEEADRAGLVLVENFMFTQHAQHAYVRKLIADGVLGELRGMSAAFTIPPLPEGDIRYSPETGGGALADVGGYPIRAASLFLGTDVTLLGAVLRTDERHGVDVGGAALLANPAGVVAHLTFGMEHAYRNEYELWGTAGRLKLTRAYTPPETYQPVLTLELGDGVEERGLEPDDQFANVLHGFVRQVRTGVPSGLSGAAILNQAELVHRIRTSAHRVPVEQDGG